MSRKNKPNTPDPGLSPEYQNIRDHPRFKMERANSRVAIEHFSLIVEELRLMKERELLERWHKRNNKRRDRNIRKHNRRVRYITLPWQRTMKFFKGMFTKKEKPKEEVHDLSGKMKPVPKD